VYVVGVDTTKEEVRQFIEQLSGHSAKLYKFIATMPVLATDITTPDGVVHTITSSQVDFLALSQTT